MRESMILALGVWVCLFTNSCGRSIQVADELRASRQDSVKGPLFRGDIKKVREAAKAGFLSCQFRDECEPALALVSVVSELGLERCTGFLISSHLVLTNDHCVNRLYGAPRNSNSHIPCKDQLFVHFSGETSDPGPTRGCKEISVRSGESGIDSQDYAVIELDEAIEDRKPLKVSARGLNDEEKTQILRVQMTSGKNGNFSGTQDRLECEVTYETYLYPQVDSPESPLMTLGDCPIVSGNSGAPVMNSDREVGAIIQGYLEPKAGSPETSVLRDHLLAGVAGKVGVATSTACVSAIQEERTLRCGPVHPIRNFPVLEYLSKFGSSGEPALFSPPHGQEWLELSPSDALLRTYVSKPICTNDSGFESLVSRFEWGVNTKMRAAWGAQSEPRLVNFEASPRIHSSTNLFFNSDLGTLSVEVCAE